MVLLKKILNNYASHSPAILSKKEGKKHPSEFEVLLSIGILQQDIFPQERWCPSCENEFVAIQTLSKEKAYSLCTTDETAGRSYFEPENLQQWRFSTPAFIALLLQALNAEQSKFNENILGLLWDLGNQKINGKQYHLFFTRSIDNIEKDKRSIITALPDTAVFYLGTVHTSLPDDVLLIPVLDIIKDLKSSGLVLSSKTLKSYFPEEIFTDEGDDLQLDKNIVLSQKRNYLLLNKKRGGGFEKETKISPQASNLIAHCFGIRHYDDNAKTLQELANALANDSKISISNKINTINKICKKEGVKEILHKRSGQLWGLNPKLDCCK